MHCSSLMVGMTMLINTIWFSASYVKKTEVVCEAIQITWPVGHDYLSSYDPWLSPLASWPS